MLFDRIALENHSYVATKAERTRNSTLWILTLKKELRNHYINDLTLLKRKENARDCTTNTWQRLNKIIGPFLAVNKRQRKRQAFEGIEECNNAVDNRTGWRFYQESRRDLPTASSSSTNWDRNNWKIRETFFSELGPVAVAWRKNFQTTDGRCEQNTHSNSMYRCSLCVATHTGQNGPISSREHVWLKIADLCVSKQLSSTCHVSFFAAPDTDLKHKFPITYVTYLSDALSFTPKSFGARSIFTLRRFTAEWRINTKPVSHTSGNVFESQPAREGPSSALFENSRHLASSS